MIVLSSNVFEMDVCATSIECNASRLLEHAFSGSKHFFVVYTKGYRLFERDAERYMKAGFDPVFFAPKDDLPNPAAWDMVMYATLTGEAVAKIENRPSQ